MIEWVRQIIEFLSSASTPRAMFLAILGGSLLTQWIKFQFNDWSDDIRHKRTVRTVSSLVTFALCMALDPKTGHIGSDTAVAIVAALSCPTIYWLSVKLLYHFFPWMENSLSSRPSSDTGEKS